MTIRHLRIFIAVYQEMNVTRAAQKLYMAQPAVTRAIQDLEQYYGVPLFERLNHRLYRTESGNALYARAVHILESFDELEEGLKAGAAPGVLRVGATITLGNFLLPAVAAAFQKQHPPIQIRAEIANAKHLHQAILDNAIDLAMVEDTLQDANITAEPLAPDHLCLILPPGHPLCSVPKILLADLPAYPLLLREPGSAGRTFLDGIFAAYGLPCVPAWQSASTQALVKAVSMGLGISILPQRLVAQDVEKGTVVTRPLADAPLRRGNTILWHRQKYLTAPAKEFIELCKRFSYEI